MKQTIVLLVILFLVKNSNAQKKTSAYAPLVVKEKTISMNGKQLDINSDGLPAMVKTSFNLVTEPIHFHIVSAYNHKDIKWKSGEIVFTTQKPEKVSWIVKNNSDSLTMEVEGSVKPDGTVNYLVKVKALNNIDLENVRLHLPFTSQAAKYVSGLGQPAGLRPALVEWKSDINTKEPGKIWVGDNNGGLQYDLKDYNSSWANKKQGGIRIEQKGGSILADNYSGLHHLKKGDVLNYNFSMMITDNAVEKSK